MLESEYRKTYELERTFWWFVAKRKISRSLLASVFARAEKESQDAFRILDAGCGTGGNLEWLAGHGSVFGVDVSDTALRFCRARADEGWRDKSEDARRIELARGELSRLPFSDGCFALVTAFDVLYHKWVRDDQVALAELARVCRPGGWLLITDSALPFLRGPHDEAYGGARRYTRRTLRDAVERAGFRVRRLSYFHFLLFPMIAAVRLKEKWFPPAAPGGSSLEPIHPFWNGILKSICSVESSLLRLSSLPWGSSIICLAQRTGIGNHSPDRR